MGYTQNTNIDLIPYYPEGGKDKKIEQAIKNNALLIFDNENCSDISIFDGLFIKDNKLTPKLISVGGEKGGGGEIINLVLGQLLTPGSQLYLPTIVINGFITKIAVDGTVEVLKQIFKKFKSEHRRKRLKIFYHDEECASFFEFPSETDVEDFEVGVREIPSAIKKSFKGKYFIWTSKSSSWFEEEFEG